MHSVRPNGCVRKHKLAPMRFLSRFAAVRLAKQIFSDLSQSHVLLIGAGETIELVGKYLIEHDVPNITIANRTFVACGAAC